MIAIVYSTTDPASMNIAAQLKAIHGMNDAQNPIKDPSGIVLYRITTSLMHADFLDELGADLIVFISEHVSAAGTPAMTVHSTGNWGEETKFGGKPRSLSVAAPSAMLAILSQMKKSKLDMAKTYEATHHGPLLNTPSVFAELGGNIETMNNEDGARAVADSVYQAVTQITNFKLQYRKVVLGIGGNHYPQKFSDLAVEKGYAFSHIMPKYSLINDNADNISMLDQALSRSSERPQTAVIDWKSLNSGIREKVITKLGNLGIGYERV